MSLIDRPAGKLFARSVYRWEADEIAIALWIKGFDGGNRHVAQPITFTRTDEPIAEPTLSLTHEAARELMDSLWNVGIRPTEHGSPGELGATKHHLADMRAITFAKLELKAPE